MAPRGKDTGACAGPRARERNRGAGAEACVPKALMRRADDDASDGAGAEDPGTWVHPGKMTGPA